MSEKSVLPPVYGKWKMWVFKKKLSDGGMSLLLGLGLGDMSMGWAIHFFRLLRFKFIFWAKIHDGKWKIRVFKKICFRCPSTYFKELGLEGLILKREATSEKGHVFVLFFIKMKCFFLLFFKILPFYHNHSIYYNDIFCSVLALLN